MKVRLFVMLLLAALGWAGRAAPRERPRLAPLVVGSGTRVTDTEARLERESAFTPQFRSFQSFLQAEARRPIGLEAGQETTEGGEASPREPQSGRSRSEGDGPAGAEILILPTVEITARKLPAEAVRLADIDSQLRSGEKASEETWLDSFLNPAFLFGETAKVRAARAKRRGEVLGWQKVLLLSLETENSPVEKARIRDDIEMLNTILRSWK